MKVSLRIALFAIILFICRVSVQAQYCSIPALPSCAGCTALTSGNQNLSSGTYCITTSLSNINLSGSAVVCVSGAGQINGGNLNGGTVIYNGGSIANPFVNLGNGGGTLRIRSSLDLNSSNTNINSNSTWIVENGATLTVSNMDVNGTLIVDRSILYVNNSFAVNSNGHVCFNNGVVNTSQFRANDQSNSSTVIGATAKGCYAIRNSYNGFNQSLSNTANVSICLPGSSVPNNTGSATVNKNCSGTSTDGGCYKALPVRLVSFQAQSVGEGVRLDWTTSMEQNFDYFQVERSSDAVAFEPISPRIKSLGGQEATRNYIWTDVYAKNGTFYYRLKQVDLDNSYTYSTIVGVVFGEENKSVSLRPNPFVNEVNVTLNSPVKGTYVIELYSTSGKLQASVTGEKSESVVTHTLTTTHLPAGFYLVNIRLGDQHIVRKILKL